MFVLIEIVFEYKLGFLGNCALIFCLSFHLINSKKNRQSEENMVKIFKTVQNKTLCQFHCALQEEMGTVRIDQILFCTRPVKVIHF